ncbi:MAG: hypothetical protein RJA30_538 [Actinomycetota bacterium]
MTTRIGVFGGSFDPVHNGHLVAAKAVAKAINLDRVVFVPAGLQWQKQSSTSGTDRLAMVRLAITGIAGFEVSDIDILRDGPTYTFDTLTEFREANPGAELFFILGTDAMAGLESWKNAASLLDLATFVVVTRPGSILQVPEWASGRVMVQEIEALDLSSTEFRERYLAGQDCTALVPPAVLDYIETHQLYKESA